jgi:hypothetical protein
MGREESRRIGEEWLDLAPDDQETPWPEHPDAVEHWWVVFYRMTWPHSGTDRPDEEDMKDLIGVESDYEPDEHYGPQHIEVVGGGPAILTVLNPWRPIWVSTGQMQTLIDRRRLLSNKKESS